MVDFFLMLLLPGSGDSLQGIKKGALELADLIAVNKADGENELRARQSARDYQSAMTLLRSVNSQWSPPVMTCSASSGQGIPAIWEQINLHQELGQETGDWAKRRSLQKVRWMWTLVEDRLIHSVKEKPDVASLILEIEERILTSDISPVVAAEQVLALFKEEQK